MSRVSVTIYLRIGIIVGSLCLAADAPILFHYRPAFARGACARPARVQADALTNAFFTTGQGADLMLSGIDFNSSGGPLVLHHPTGIASDGIRFLLCDRFNNRVLVWNSLPDRWDAPPDLALGQKDLLSNNPGTSRGELNWPGNVSVAESGVVAVADTENDRILIWTRFPSRSGQPADIAVSLTALSPGVGGRFEWPWGVWTDGHRLSAVATQGAALLFWDSLPVADDQPPDYVIRLPEFGTPRNISTDGSTYFFVGDHNARVGNNQPSTYFWNSYPSRPNQPFDFYRTEWVKGTRLPGGQLIVGGLGAVYLWNTMPTTGAIPPDLMLRYPTYANGDGPDVVFAGGRLYINNYNGNNVHVYNSIPRQPSQRPDFALGSPSADYCTLNGMNYVQNPVLATDGRGLVVTSDFDRVLWIWKSLPFRSGTPPDLRISLAGPDLAPWDNALHNGRLVLAGKRKVGIWDSLPLAGEAPSRTFAGRIGSVQFDELRGVALDDRYLYLADANGTISVWSGLPATGNENPVRTFQLPAIPPNHLNSDGTYLCVTAQSAQPAVYVYRVADIAGSGTSLQPFKAIVSSQTMRLNLPASALPFEGGLAIANTSGNAVLIWKDISDAGDPGKAIALGQSAVSGVEAAIGANRLFMPASLAYDGSALWVGEVKFSSRILKFSKGTAPHRWYVPVVVGSGGRAGGLAIVNPSATPARVEFMAYSDLGAALGTASRSLEPGQQSSELISQIFPTMETQPAWIQVESSATALAGFYLLFDEGVRMLDGASMTDVTLRDSILPADEEGEVNLVNPGDAQADFQLQYISDAGESIRNTRGTIPARGRAQIPTRDLRRPGEQGGYIRCGSSAGILALLSSLRGQRLVLFAPADAAAVDSATKFMPHWVFGGGYATRLRLVNLDDAAREFIVSLRANDGNVLGTPAKIGVPPRGSAALVDSSAFGLQIVGSGFIQGYLRIEGENGRFTGQALIGDPAGEIFGTSVLLAPPRGGEVRYAQAATTDLWYTGVAMLNSGNQAAPVYAALFNPTGGIMAGRDLVIPPGGRWVGLLPQLLGAASILPAAHLRIGAGQPGVTIAMIGATDLSALASITP